MSASTLKRRRPPVTGHEEDRGWKILLVEDSFDDAAQAQHILEKSERIGEVIPCYDAASLFHALEKNKLNRGVENNDPRSLILLDIHLPGIDGMVLLEQLKTSPLTDNIPIIILTGDTNLDMIYKSYKHHANAFISKPLTAADLHDIYTVFDEGSFWKKDLN